MSLVQTELERRGITTVSLTVMPDVTRQLAPPRALSVDAPLGAVVGPAHDDETQRHVLRQMLRLAGHRELPLLVGHGTAAR